jgi:uncharacterized damage-inducible protein DinB
MQLNTMKVFFKDLLEYSHYYNQKLADIFIEKQDVLSERAIKLFSHILNAHHIWNNRIEQKATLYTVWEIHPVEEFKHIDLSNYQQSLLILQNFDFEQTINYQNSLGQHFTNNFQNILFHVINHSTYHRAQIATEFKLCGVEPLLTDYIVYKRSKSID